MKIPQTFLPEKDLENKIQKLTKRPKKSKEPDFDKSIGDTIFTRAKEVAIKLGELNEDSVYTFEDKKTGLSIEYDLWWYNQNRIYIYFEKYDPKSRLILPDLVFEATEPKQPKPPKRKMPLYKPGEWEKELEEIYTWAM